jgi:hypothetical protein
VTHVFEVFTVHKDVNLDVHNRKLLIKCIEFSINVFV